VRDHAELIPAEAEKWRPEEVLSWAFATYGKDVAIASGFGVEGMVLLDLASRVRSHFRVFTLDTEFLFPETYDLMDRVEKRYGLRKVEPLRTKLTELRAWITAIRRDQTSARASARKVEWDAKFQLLKINPIADWTSPMVWSYALKHNVPYNPLHDKNYPSIGCTHCTRAVRPGESARAGRWSGSDKVECGLHVAAPTAIAPLVEIKVKSSFGCEES
jgi:phosphoadenosine phosphosulfate reductase